MFIDFNIQPDVPYAVIVQMQQLASQIGQLQPQAPASNDPTQSQVNSSTKEPRNGE